MLILHAKFANRRCLRPALRVGNQNTTNNSIQRTLRWHWRLLLGRASGRSSRGLRTASALSELNESLVCSGPARSLLAGLCNFPSESLGFLLGWSWCSECVVSWLPDRWHVRGALHRLVWTDPCQCRRLNARWVSQNVRLRHFECSFLLENLYELRHFCFHVVHHDNLQRARGYARHLGDWIYPLSSYRDRTSMSHLQVRLLHPLQALPRCLVDPNTFTNRPFCPDPPAGKSFVKFDVFI